MMCVFLCSWRIIFGEYYMRIGFCSIYKGQDNEVEMDFLVLAGRPSQHGLLIRHATIVDSQVIRCSRGTGTDCYPHFRAPSYLGFCALLFQVCAEAYWTCGQFETSVLPCMAYFVFGTLRKILTLATGRRWVCDCDELSVCLHLHLQSDSCTRDRLAVVGLALWKESKRRDGDFPRC